MLTIFVERAIYERDRIRLYLCDRDSRTQELRPIILSIAKEPLKPSEYVGTDQMPTTMSIAEAQTLMEEFWRIGIRPTGAQGSVGQLDAVQAHLKDLQRLVFNKDGDPR